MPQNQTKSKKLWLNGTLLLCVVLLAVLPLLTLRQAEFKGADNQASEVISELAPDYKPWFSSVIQLPSSEVESLLFAVQASIGTGVICFGLGYLLGKRKKDADQ